MTQQIPGATGTPLPARDAVRAVLLFWIAAAGLTGLLHGMELLVTRIVFGQLVWYSREFVWMSPVAYALVMAPGTLVLVILAALVRRQWALTFAAGAFVVVSVFGLLLPFSQISRTASLILALGVAVTIVRSVHAHPQAWVRRSRAAAFACTGFVVVIPPAQRSLRMVRESSAVASLPAPPSDATNVLVIILDTVRAASVGLYSVTDSTTPRLNEWSRSSTVFDWAFSPSAWTLPSHGSMFTGVWPGQLPVNWKVPMDDRFPTLAERFRDRGYLTAGFVANLHYAGWDSGLPRGFVRYEDYLVNARQLLLSSSYTQTRLYEQLRQSRNLGEAARAVVNSDLTIDPNHHFAFKRAGRLTDQFLRWQGANGQRPFFAFLNYFDAHRPYYAPQEFQRFTDRRGLGQYRAAIAYLDAEVDRLLSTLRDRGVLDNTLVVITSDHGELFGYKGMYGHAHNLYLKTIHVPLLVRLPSKVPQGIRVTQPVTLRDLAATILGLVAPGAPSLPGVSLARTWTNAQPASPVVAELVRGRNIEDHYPASRTNLQSLIDDRWQLIRQEDDGRLELYDYRADSLEQHDVALDDSSREALARARDRLLQVLGSRR